MATATPVLRRAVGILLIAASTLKFGHFLSQPAGLHGATETAFLLGLVAAEYVLGAGLLCGALLAIVRPAAVARFAGFAVYTVGKIVGGATDCGCLGLVSIPPQAMLAVDVLALCVLAGDWILAALERTRHEVETAPFSTSPNEANST